MMNYKTLVATSLMSVLMSISLTSFASAQCVDCAMYPDRDALNKNTQTPAGKSGLIGPGGAAGSPNAAGSANAAAGSANAMGNANNPNNARAEMRERPSKRSVGVSGTRKHMKSPDYQSR
ncbi:MULTISPECIES: hypothetical protein [unclassified Bradyrhizobium]|uniref:hypothetical protein n=1 Tax=unclassified Bradyrhizobium TaxID=2631580 RepID=UPI0024785A3C|nr:MULTISPECIES: hypothetical protein [unclassified Bradyrhizobium]WGR71365.1 hypothetical protein MTX24_39710 [Bradyrhizobium sp. ISRA426]WGR76200.1 hypothetical protein MTX21_24815 [Bradyrhizobium sp. ISRA430]WGR86605.1 hypothetical protein MTX25_39400 [Bradyrhizobium sp. ISRA432]